MAWESISEGGQIEGTSEGWNALKGGGQGTPWGTRYLEYKWVGED